MDSPPDNLVVSADGKNLGILLAPDHQDALAFRQYTQRVWSRAAGRLISIEEADQIIEDFARFLRALARPEGGPE